MAEYCVWCRHIVLSRRNKATQASDRRPSAPWVLSSAGKLIRYLHGSYFLPYRSADVSLFCFLSAISIFLSLDCSLNALSFVSRVDTPLTADWLQVCFGTRPRLRFLKRFWKMTYPTFNWSMLPHLSHLFKRARAGLNEPHWTRYRAGTLVKLSGLRGSIVLKHGSDPLVWVHPKLSE